MGCAARAQLANFLLPDYNPPPPRLIAGWPAGLAQQMTNRKPSPSVSAASILLCSCEDSMPLDTAAVERGCRGAKLTTARQLCRKELALARSLAETSQALTIACTQ